MKNNRDNTIKKGSTKKIGIFIGIIAIVITVVFYLWIGGAFKSGKKHTITKRARVSDTDKDFKYASSGESWIIHDDNIGVMKEPKTTSDRTEFLNNLVTVLESGEKVEVIRTKPIYWKYCKVKGIYYGWILGDTIKSASKIR